jgi:alpha-glucosidase
LYLDDGTTTQAELNQKYRYVEISHQQINNTRQVTFNRLFDQYTPNETFYYVALLGTAPPQNVFIGGNDISNANTPEVLEASPVNGYYWNAGIGITFIKVFDNASSIQIDANF